MCTLALGKEPWSVNDSGGIPNGLHVCAVLGLLP